MGVLVITLRVVLRRAFHLQPGVFLHGLRGEQLFLG
jgi:hypothetical protein